MSVHVRICSEMSLPQTSFLKLKFSESFIDFGMLISVCKPVFSLILKMFTDLLIPICFIFAPSYKENLLY